MNTTSLDTSMVFKKVVNILQGQNEYKIFILLS